MAEQCFSCCDQQLILLQLRVLLDDLDETDIEFTDKRLSQVIFAAAKAVKAEVLNICQTYQITIDCDTGEFDICPTPDETFASLIVAKAACMLFDADMKYKLLSEGVSAKCGPVSASVSSASGSWQYFLQNGPCATYQKLKEKTEFRDPMATGFAFTSVLGPFVSNTFKCCGCGGYTWGRTGGCGCGSSSPSINTRTCNENNPEKT